MLIWVDIFLPVCHRPGNRPQESLGGGITDSHLFTQLIDWIGLIENSGSLTCNDRAGLRQWFSDYVTWLRTSRDGIQQKSAPNNHGTLYDLQLATYEIFTGRVDSAIIVVENSKNRFQGQINKIGEQYYELRRQGFNQNYSYSSLNLMGWIYLAQLSQKLGTTDLFNYELSDGSSIRRALDWLAPYALTERPDSTTYYDGNIYQMLTTASTRYTDPYYSVKSKAFAKRRPMDKLDFILYSYPVTINVNEVIVSTGTSVTTTTSSGVQKSSKNKTPILFNSSVSSPEVKVACRNNDVPGSVLQGIRQSFTWTGGSLNGLGMYIASTTTFFYAQKFKLEIQKLKINSTAPNVYDVDSTIKTLVFSIHETEVDANQYLYLQLVTPVSLDANTIYGFHLVPISKTLGKDQKLHFLRAKDFKLGYGSFANNYPDQINPTVTKYGKRTTETDYNFFMTSGTTVTPYRSNNSFETGLSVADPVTLIPNPAQSGGSLLRVVTQEKEVHISISNLSGRVLHAEVLNVENGIAELKINTETLTPGVYLIHYKSNDVQGSRKLVVK